MSEEAKNRPPVDPAIEEAYWREAFSQRPYSRNGGSYEDFASAYRAGWEVYEPGAAAEWAEREQTARQRWESEGGAPTLSWHEARQASEDAYRRVHQQRPR